MKKPFNFLLGALLVTIAFTCFNACSKDDPDNIYAFFASLNGTNAVPANSSAALGDCNVTYDSVSNLLSYTISWKDLSNAPASIYFEKGIAGTPGYKQIPVTDFPLEPTNGVSGYITLNQEDQSDLISGNFYVNITTSNYNTGEIRGRLEKIE